jgi:hypothetical protein
MSLGSFVQGAFQGYKFGEDAKDRKKERARNEERFEWERGDEEWRSESRDRERENWDYTDIVRGRQQESWEREDKQRRKTEATQDELDRIRDQGFEEWKGGQGGQPVPQNIPQGTVRVPLDASGGAGQPVSGSSQATFPGLNVPGVSQPNANATPFRYGDDVPRMENRPIRVPLGNDTVAGNMGNDMLLTDIQPVRGTYSEEEQRGAPRPPQPPNAMDPHYRAPVFTDLAAPAASRRAPSGPVSPDTIAAETGGEAIRDEGALTYGGGAQPRPSAPGMPVDPRAPAGPEAGQPQLQAARNARTVLGDAPETQVASIPADTQEETGSIEAPQTPELSLSQADTQPEAVAPGASVRRQNRAAQSSTAPVESAGPAFVDERLSRRPGYRQAPSVPEPSAPSTGSRGRAGLENPSGPQPAPQPGMGAASAAETPAQPGQPQAAPAPAPRGSGAGQPVYGGMTASQAAQFQDLPEPRMALEDGGQPISIARDSLASNANVDNNGQAPQVTDQQRIQGAATFREYYQSQVVPRQIEALYKAGDIEAAEQLQTWLEDERSQGLQENYARAVHAASIGDERGFFDYLGKVYNSFDDGYRFIADESDLSKNEAGQTIATVTLENTATGERFTQEYEGGEELIQQVLTQMDPISVFEQLKGQAEAEAAAAAEQQAWEIGESRRRIEDGFETPSDRRKVFSDAWKQLSESSPNWLSMSPEEKVIAVEDFLAQADTFATGGTAQPEAPVYLGD